MPVRVDWGKIKYKKIFMYMNKDKNGQENFEELNFEAKSER